MRWRDMGELPWMDIGELPGESAGKLPGEPRSRPVYRECSRGDGMISIGGVRRVVAMRGIRVDFWAGSLSGETASVFVERRRENSEGSRLAAKPMPHASSSIRSSPW